MAMVLPLNLPRSDFLAQMRALFHLPQWLLKSAPQKAELSLLMQKARLAQRHKNWRAALELWRTSVEKAPGNPTAAAGYTGVLIYVGAVPQARRRAESFVRRWTTDENGPMLLARIAEVQGDLGRAIDEWRRALALVPGTLQPLIRLGSALIAERRFTEAEICVAELKRHHPAKPYAAVLRAQIVQRANGYPEASRLWRQAADKFATNADFLRAYGRALIAAGEYEECLAVARRLRNLDPYGAIRLQGMVLSKRCPYQDQTQFWQAASAELPDNAGMVRSVLDAALRARQFEQAHAAFQRLLDLNQLRASDADYVTGLAQSYFERDQKMALRQTVRDFLGGLREHPGYRAAAVRLHRVILASFPRSTGAAVAVSRNAPRFVRMVRGAQAGNAGEMLERIAALEDRLIKSGASCLFDTDIDAGQCRQFIRTVHQRVKGARAFSLIRLGDGEANALAYEPSYATYFDADAAERENVWWGRTPDTSTRAEVAAGVRAAADGADVWGIPTRDRFLRDVRLDTGRPLATTRSGRGLLTILRMVETMSDTELRRRIFVSAHLPQDLQRWNLYPELFQGIGDALLVSCHAALPNLLLERFGVRVTKHVLTPPGDSIREMQHRSLTDQEMPPQSIYRTLEALGDSMHGRLVLVGAGYSGKII
ncbi:MAG: tetratricopeptide repeat protein, partial [Sinobacteraceae bacterium]|nr:tetratricopeptide repeat protein [Nevskiaceae bacterium]